MNTETSKQALHNFYNALELSQRMLKQGLPVFNNKRPKNFVPAEEDASAEMGMAREYLLKNLSPVASHNFRLEASHPINLAEGLIASIEKLWAPLITAIHNLQRRMYICSAGEYNGKQWVCSTGILIGVFNYPWLGIPPTGGMVSLRYGEFFEVVDGKLISEDVLFDVPHFMQQAGYHVFAENMDCEMRSFFPPPATQDGLVKTSNTKAQERGLKLMEDMAGGLMRYRPGQPQLMTQEKYWSKTMGWYGPWGIGSSYGLGGFEDFHQFPFLNAFPDRRGGHSHRYRYAEGNYIASGGWPSVIATHTGGNFMGLPPTGKTVEMRVMDFWRAGHEPEDGGAYLLQENWVFIDLLHLLLQMGVDVFSPAYINARNPNRRPLL